MENRKRGKRTPKRKPFADEVIAVKKKTPVPKSTTAQGFKVTSAKRCQKPSCGNKNPVCCVKQALNCCGEIHNSSRWYHISDGEHFCNDCFELFYRSHKDGHKKFDAFKLHWSVNCRKEPTLKTFFSEELIPYWAQCTKCQKWRQLDKDEELTPEYSELFECKKIKGMSCSKKEVEYVKQAKNILWLGTLTSLPYLKDSPAAPFLRDFYYDCIGLSPPVTINDDPSIKFAENLIPFYRAQDSEKARCLCADVMTAEERIKFPHHTKDPAVFLGIRNLIVTMWSINPKEFALAGFSFNQENWIYPRGMGRITLAEELKKILDFITLNGFVNFGILPRVPQPFNQKYWKGSVLIIGGGIAGISAARRLHSAGCKVKLLEASKRVGGRIKDDVSLGNCIGLGAQIITGCINNPLFVMCEQTSLPVHYLGTRCDLMDDSGSIVDSTVDQEIEFRFNLMLDSLEDWKVTINKKEHEKYSLSGAFHILLVKTNYLVSPQLEHWLEMDLSTRYFKDQAIAEQLKELQRTLNRNITQIEKNLLQFHLGNLEYGCGSSLSSVSAVHWNQNEEFPQYSGPHAWATNGFQKIIDQLSDGLDIRYNTQAVFVDHSKKTLKVTLKNGEVLSADKVICALPLTAYKSKSITFQPNLPDAKVKALEKLGAGLIEKIALKFKKPFWRRKIGETDYFGHVPGSEKDRGLFSVFYDVSKGNDHILMTVIAGEAVELKRKLNNKELVKLCMETLKNIFKDEKVDDPISYVISDWANDPFVKMAYSYVKVGSSGKDLDTIATPVNDRLYFAGEVTNRQFPQTVTGAYLSGLREAKNILLSET